MKVETKIIEIFNRFPATKDDDNLLFSHYLLEFHQDDFEDLEDLAFVATIIKDHRLATLFSTIRRQRQKVQEVFPNLRGSKWLIRHGMAEEFRQYYAAKH